MDVRKIISFGKNSYIISLPKQWVEKNKLNKGDLVSIDENKEGLLLKINNTETKKDEPKTAIINAENKNISTLRTEIISAYLDNYDNIEIVSDDLQTNFPGIKKMTQDLAGFEIINQSSTKIVAKDLIDIHEISILTLIRRMDNIVRSMMQDTVECFDGIDHSESAYNIDEEVNRLHFLVYRVIRSGLKDVRIANSLGTNALKLHSDHNVTTKIERIADDIKRVCKYIKDTKLNKEWKNELKEIFRTVQQSYLDVMKAYYTNDSQIALKIEEYNKELIKNCDNFFNKHNHKDLKFGNERNKKGVCNFRISCGATAKVIEHMKGMVSEIKFIARTIIGGG